MQLLVEELEKYTAQLRELISHNERLAGREGASVSDIRVYLAEVRILMSVVYKLQELIREEKKEDLIEVSYVDAVGLLLDNAIERIDADRLGEILAEGFEGYHNYSDEQLEKELKDNFGRTYKITSVE